MRNVMKAVNVSALSLSVFLWLACAVCTHAGYIGATCGWQYSAQLEGPVTYPNQTNIALYNPQSGNPTATWEDWAAQIHQAGLDFICPNLTGSWPNSNDPATDMAPLVTALNNLGNVTKFAIFDDNAASWCAQWNMANGRGFGYAQPFDVSNPANWVFIYDYNYKLFYQTVPDAQRFKINDRPVIWIWTGGSYFIANAQGNLSQAMMYVRQKCQSEFGFNPYIVGNEDFIVTDSTCANPGVLDATHSWFGPPIDPYTLSIFNNAKTGVAVAQFQNLSNPSGFLNPDHGLLLENGLQETVNAGAQITLLEGFTDYEEDAAFFRVRNLDANGNPLSYSQTYYDYPNQRLNIIRKYTNHPFPASLKLEAEGCDTYGGAAGGGIPRLYRNGNIAIEATQDQGGGFDIGWIQANEWFQWQQVPMEGNGVLQVRAATNGDNRRIHFVIDGQTKPTVTLPNTGGYQVWTTVDTPAQTFTPGSYHTVRLVCETSGMNVNWIRWVAGGAGNNPPSVTLTSPSDNTRYSPMPDVTINAAASDSNGSISKVDFYAGVSFLGTDMSAPYSHTWNNVPAGNHRLTAKATDNNGAITTSTPIFVQVDHLALGKPVVASSTTGGNVASKAVDGNMGTRWESGSGDPQWIYVDLGSTRTIERVVLKWEYAYASGYQIQVSENASNWTQIYGTTTGDGGTDDLDVTGSGRYVRMYGTNRGTPHAYSLYEFEVYGSQDDPGAGDGTGLTGDYYNNMDLTGFTLTRTDSTVNFSWGDGSPDASIGSDTFSVQWNGYVEPLYSEAYTFYTVSDDGVRLWVNGQLLVDNWTNHGPVENSGTITLSAGIRYEIVMEYYENGGGAVAQLLWSSASQSKQIIPQFQLYPVEGAGEVVTLYQHCDYAGWAAGFAVGSYTAADIIAGGGINNDASSVAVAPGYQVTLYAEDNFQGASLVKTADDTCLVDDGWNDSISSLVISLAGQQEGTGLTGDYYNNMDLTGYALTRTDSTVNFSWGDGSPDALIGSDTFSVQWSGQVKPLHSETYTFYTVSDDGVRLWVNGQLLVDNWTNHSPVENSGTISLSAGVLYEIVMEYYENGGGAAAQLLWSSASQSKQVIPQTQLYL